LSPATEKSSWRWLISVAILFHLSAVGLSYATNWRRSTVQDALLTGLQPYLITGNWYQEMLPIEWISDTSSRPVRLLVQTNNGSKEWKQVLDVSEKGPGRVRAERLLHVLSELASNDDTLGLTHVLKSIVVHLESENKDQNSLVSKIRLEKNMEYKAVISGTEDVLSDETESVQYEAELARFAGGEFGFVPKIESNRSVRSLKESAVAK